MTFETSKEDKLVAIRDKIKKIITDAPNIVGVRKIYNGTPKSIPNYPSIMLAWNESIPEQANKGKTEIRERHSMSIIVLEKYLDYDKRQNKLLVLTGQIKKLMVENRYLDGLRADDGSWKNLGVVLGITRYEALIKPKSFVLDSSEINITVVTEGL